MRCFRADPGVASSPGLHASYETYAAGVQVAEVDSGFSFGPWNYQMTLGYHTTGMVGLFFRGHQFDTASGTWRGGQAAPSRFIGTGEWRGEERLAEIDYLHGKPAIRQLVPPNANEREQVPDSLQANSIDTLSALAALIHVVRDTGRCETAVRTYDGRRAVEIEARTVGEEVLEKTPGPVSQARRCAATSPAECSPASSLTTTGPASAGRCMALPGWQRLSLAPAAASADGV